MRGARIIPWSLYSISDVQLLFLSTDEGIEAQRGPSYCNSPEVHQIGLVLIFSVAYNLVF